VRPLLQRSLLALGVGLCALLALEIAGRRLVEPPTSRHGFVSDFELGWALPPSSEMAWAGEQVAVNRLGLRGPAPREAALSLLAVGDSSVFGDGVATAQTFSARLEALLAPRVDAAVHNGGVPGYTCPQALGAARRFADRWAPPDVLVVYAMHSDVRAAAQQDLSSAGFGRLGSFGLGRLAAAAAARLRARRGTPGSQLADYRACLDDMARAQSRHGGVTVYVVPVLDTDLNTPALEKLAAAQRRVLYTQLERLSSYRTVMVRAAHATGSPLVDLPAALRARGLTPAQGLLDQVHPSVEGHAAIAEVLAAALAEAKYTP
jgi:lysophospholipase L1-like esterase